MKKLNREGKAAIISASVIAAPLIGLFAFRAGQNLKVCRYFKELYPNAAVTKIKEIEHYGFFGGKTYTKKITLYDKEHGFSFDQTFYYEGLKALPLNDANAVWRERYLNVAVSCENIVNAIPECYSGEYFTRYSVGGVFTNGFFIFLKQPPADEFESLIEGLSAVSAENFNGSEYRRAYEGYIESSVIVLPPSIYEKMREVDFSRVYEEKNTSNWRKGDYEEYIGRMFKNSLSVTTFPMYAKEDTVSLSEFYDGTLGEDRVLCAELHPKGHNGFTYFDLI